LNSVVTTNGYLNLMPYGTLLQLKINYIEYVERGNTPV